MAKAKVVVAYEYGTLAKQGVCSKGEIALCSKAFDNLWNYALRSSEEDGDSIMTCKIKCGHKVVKLKNYVGTIQTADGTSIEILPKIYSDFIEENDETQKDLHIEKCRKLFLRMIASIKDAKSKTFGKAALGTKENFPILESYISNYVAECERLFRSGIKSDYQSIEEESNFLKGKLLVSKHIQKNCVDKSKFFVRHSKYIQNIAQNRILVSTLHYLLKITAKEKSKRKINNLLKFLDGIPKSENIQDDLQKAANGNRLFGDYSILMEWSGQFLLNRGFTNFSGKYVNISLLFPAEKLFESYIAFLFKKYAFDYVTSAQHSKYYLIEKHQLADGHDKKFFHLRPDMFLESKNSDKEKLGKAKKQIIIDTKWKSLDETKSSSNYLIDIKDMYQLYAYGQKYKTENDGENALPLLALIYPKTQKHTGNIPPFNYDGKGPALRLKVFAFDLLAGRNNWKNGAREEVRRIINELQDREV